MTILIEAYEICKIENISFTSSMTTNGLLINQEMLDICKKYSLTSFQITLDGNRERHNKVRYISENLGSFDKIIKGIILIVKNKLIVNLRINCSADTMLNMHALLD